MERLAEAPLALALDINDCQPQELRFPMPTYVYKFVETGETIEVQQAFTDDALTEAVHPTSGATMQVKKVFQPVGVTFKGGGFYKTDSRGGSSKSASSSSSSTSTSTESSSSSTDSSSSTTAAAPAPAASSTSTATPA
jgi:predicted nucleic acid-binding Zn ribbon protein